MAVALALATTIAVAALGFTRLLLTQLLHLALVLLAVLLLLLQVLLAQLRRLAVVVVIVAAIVAAVARVEARIVDRASRIATRVVARVVAAVVDGRAGAAAVDDAAVVRHAGTRHIAGGRLGLTISGHAVDPDLAHAGGNRPAVDGARQRVATDLGSRRRGR